MATPPSQSPEPDDMSEHQAAPLTPEGRRRRDILAMSTTYLPTAPSWGERLLPYFFIAMETCWIAAILVGLASINFFQSHEPLIPLWSPFLLMAGSCWLSVYLERRELAGTPASVDSSEDQPSVVSGSRLIFAFIAGATLFTIWSSVYAPYALIIDPRWLLALLNDLLLLDGSAYHVIVIIILSVYFCWRGVRLSRQGIEPGNIMMTLRVGLGVIIMVILVRAGANANDTGESTLLLLVLLFLSLVLISHAIAQALFLRRSSPTGLQGSIAAQERALLLVVGMVCLLLSLVALAIGAFASPTTLEEIHLALRPIGLAYDWLVSAIAYSIIFLLTPIFWLISQLHLQVQVPRVKLPGTNGNLLRNSKPASAPEALLVTIAILKIALPLLITGFLLLLIRFALRRRRVVLTRRQEGDVHESLWSWVLFWTQLKSLLLAIWRRFFARRAPAEEKALASASLQGEPMARSIREMYRVLLRWAANQGYPRTKYETPYEFQMRLNEHLPQVEPELGVVTEAYMEIRYGEVVPDVGEVVQAQRAWVNLQKKYTSSKD
jgi:Domain of unknown function (DUF4129)